jgi:uncharacterized protein YjdB
MAVRPKSVKSVAVTAADGGTAPTVQVGSTIQLKAVATLADASTIDVTTSSQWASNAVSKATVDGSGKVTGVAAGTTEVTATSGDATSSAVTVTVSA